MPTAEVPATADLYDEHGESLQSCDLQMRQYGATRSFGGTITTVRCFDDNVLVKSILGEDGEGRVLVVDGSGSVHTALMGDMIAEIAMTNRWAGIVINGAVRDVAGLAKLPIGIKALGSNPRKTRRAAQATATSLSPSAAPPFSRATSYTAMTTASWSFPARARPGSSKSTASS